MSTNQILKSILLVVLLYLLLLGFRYTLFNPIKYEEKIIEKIIKDYPDVQEELGLNALSYRTNQKISEGIYHRGLNFETSKIFLIQMSTSDLQKGNFQNCTSKQSKNPKKFTFVYGKYNLFYPFPIKYYIYECVY